MNCWLIWIKNGLKVNIDKISVVVFKVNLFLKKKKRDKIIKPPQKNEKERYVIKDAPKKFDQKDNR